MFIPKKDKLLQSKRKSTSLADFEGAALCSQFPGSDSPSGLTHTHTHTQRQSISPTSIMQPTSIDAFAQEGILALICCALRE